MDSAIWSLEDEVALLRAMNDLGPGDWAAIGRRIGRSAVECDAHYSRVYTKGPFSHGERQSGLCRENCAIQMPYDLEFKNQSLISTIAAEATLNSSIPRLRHRSFGPSQSLVRGYNAARGEFDQEYDDSAEKLLALLTTDSLVSDDVHEDLEDQELCDDLRAAVISAYNFRLEERWRWKRIIRRHALIDQRKTFNFIHRYENVIGKEELHALMQCMRFFSGPQIDILLESLKYQKELKVKASKLGSYRRLGIKKQSMVSLYEKSFRDRIDQRHALEAHTVALDAVRRAQKRLSTPLVLYNMPGYTELEDDEKELCSTSRIVPETYLGFKKLLIQECQRLNGLKLAQARPLFKIDVNKTRKMYDYLITKGLIWKPSSK